MPVAADYDAPLQADAPAEREEGGMLNLRVRASDDTYCTLVLHMYWRCCECKEAKFILL